MTVDAAIAALEARGATVVRTGAGVIVVVPAAPAATGAELLSLEEAARIARVSVRSLRDARRRGELEVLGRQRTRVVRRAELERWIADRLAPVVAPIEDADIDRRVRRLARSA